MKSIKTVFILCILLYFTNFSFSQNKIEGTITDNNKLPLFGVSVLIKGTSKGTITNIDGYYSIDQISTNDILVFRYLGFETQEIKYKKEKRIDVILEVASIELEETIVVGYGTSRKIDLTGSVGSVNVESLSQATTSNFDQALAGRVAGVQVTSVDGTPGEQLSIVIRGGNSITGDNSPLYVVDGIPMEGFDPASISTMDIKSFDILKDASATAIYGARGANGVILITTSSGVEDGTINIRLNVSGGLQYIPNRLEVMTPYEYVRHQQKIAWAKDNFVPGTFTNLFNKYWVDPELYRDQKGTSWQDEIFQTSFIQNYNISVSGGTPKSSIYCTIGYVDQEGTLINTGFKKFNNRLRFQSKVTDHFRINSQITYNRITRTGLQLSGSDYHSVIRDAIVFRPIEPIYNKYEDDSDIEENDPYLYNPVASLLNTDRKRLSTSTEGSVGLEYDFLKRFTFNSKFYYRENHQEVTLFYGENTQQGKRSSFGINGSVENIVYESFTNSNTLNYQSEYKKSNYNVLLGTEIQSNPNHRSYLRNNKIPTDLFGIDNLGIATTPTIATSARTANSLASFFTRINWNYDDRYLATVNFRSDGSSKFQKGNQWGHFPSFSLAWRASEESFFKDISYMTNLKLRGGWGITGNNRIGNFQSFNLMSVSSSSGYVLNEGEIYTPGIYQSNLGVPDLRWESTSQFNFGLDYGFLRNRINGTIEYYLKRTKDLLLDAPMALSTGFSTVQQNVGEVENKGLEISIDAVFIKKRNFSWTSNFNISFNRNKTIKLNSGQSYILIDPRWDVGYIGTEYQYITQIGQPVGMIYGLEYDGIYQMSDFIWENADSYSLKPDLPSYLDIMHPGLAKFKDQLTVDTDGDGIPDAGDGVINEDDRVIIGNPHPKHIGGFGHDIKYRNFDLQVLFQWAYGFDILNANKAVFTNYRFDHRNGFPELADAWTPYNTDTDVSGIRYNNHNLSPKSGYRVDSRYVDDGSYLKLKTLVLGYRLPKKLTTKLNFNSCRFSLSAQNLFTLTAYKGYDPDVSVGKYGALTPSLDYSAYPQSIVVSLGIDVRF